MLRRISGFILFTFFVCLTLPQAAQAAITLYDADETTFSVDGSFNTFYVFSSTKKNEAMKTAVDEDGDFIFARQDDRDQSRVKMGFLPNWIGFNFSKQVNNLKLGGRSSFWVTINDSDNNLTESGIDVRQFYGTVDADWGQVLFGKDFTLFNRSNIFLDEILLGYGNVSDTLGLIDGNGVSFGNIGTGYTYPFPSAQITYRTPQLHGFKLALGVIDPSRTADEGQEKTPRFEGELTFNHKFERGDITAWSGFLYQKSESNALDGMDITSKGVSYGVRARYAGFSLHASGFNAEGLGFLLGPGADTTLDLPVAAEPGGELDSNGWLLQASYTYGPLRFVGSYGENELKAADKWENQTATGAVFYSVNDYFKLVAEYNVNEISIGTAEEETKTVALGAILNF